MDYYSSRINALIDELAKLPGVGQKSAQRLAFHLVNLPLEAVEKVVHRLNASRASASSTAM